MMDVIVEDLPQKSESESDKSPLASARSGPIAHMALGPRFNITDPSDSENKMMAEIWAYAQSNAKSSEISDVIWEVIHLENVLGSPQLGESRLDRLYRYAKLKRQEAQIQSEIKNVHFGSHNIR